MPNDMENYTQYCIMGSVRIRMRPNCVPSKFICYIDVFTFLNSAAQKSPLFAKKLPTITISTLGKLELLAIMYPGFIVNKNDFNTCFKCNLLLYPR